MIYAFDTSAINRLHDDIDCEALTNGLVSTTTTRITALNVIEAVGTEDWSRRKSLVRLLQKLGKGFRPLATPNTLLRIVAKAHADSDDRPTITCPEEEDSIWIALNSPDDFDEEMRQEVFEWKSALENPFTDSHREARAQFQKLFESGDAQRPQTAAAFIRQYRDNNELLLESMQTLYEHCTGNSISAQEAKSFLTDIPHWRLYYAGWAHAIYARAIRTHKYGVRNKPGTLDLWCAIYLPHCDVFVTDDIPQRRALRFVNVLNPYPTCIRSYNGFRSRMIVNCDSHQSEGTRSTEIAVAAPMPQDVT